MKTKKLVKLFKNVTNINIDKLVNDKRILENKNKLTDEEKIALKEIELEINKLSKFKSNWK